MIINYAAIYIRLSLEDDDIVCGKLESESITNQRNLLHDYIQNSPELCHAEVIEFCDDGYSGKNFDRPGVKKLLEAARSGAIQCILVKDLSRFGRDYITVSNYVSRVFPFLGIRFIAVNDHIDSMRKGDIDNIDTAFKAIIYVKQKAVLLEQREDAHKRETELRQRIADISTANSRYVEKYSCYSELDTLTSEISFDLLDRVTIWPDGRLEITLNYLDESPLRLDGKGEYHNGSKESVDLLSGSAS